MTGDLSGYNQFVRVTRRTKRQREKANSPVVQVVQLESLWYAKIPSGSHLAEMLAFI
jgi:hypothetical protein